MIPMPQPWAREVDWQKIAEIAAEELCSEDKSGVDLGCDDECMTCAGIKGARWAMSVKREHDVLLAHTREVEAALKQATQRADNALEGLGLLYDKWELGDSVTEYGDEDGSYMGNSVRLSYEEEESVIALLKGRDRSPSMNDGKPSWRDRAETAEASLAASPSLWLGRAMSVVQESSDIDEAERGIQKLITEIKA